MSESIEHVVEYIESAFAQEETPPADATLAKRFQDSEDGYELVAAIGGRHWTELEEQLLFQHREALGMLSSEGYRAVLGAFLRASLTGSSERAGEILGYTLMSLRSLSNDPEDLEIAEQRLSGLTAEQRNAIAAYLQYVDAQWSGDEAARILESWR